jgi:hypothetical protein
VLRIEAVANPGTKEPVIKEIPIRVR